MASPDGRVTFQIPTLPDDDETRPTNLFQFWFVLLELPCSIVITFLFRAAERENNNFHAFGQPDEEPPPGSPTVTTTVMQEGTVHFDDSYRVPSVERAKQPYLLLFYLSDASTSATSQHPMSMSMSTNPTLTLALIPIPTLTQAR